MPAKTAEEIAALDEKGGVATTDGAVSVEDAMKIDAMVRGEDSSLEKNPDEGGEEAPVTTEEEVSTQKDEPAAVETEFVDEDVTIGGVTKKYSELVAEASEDIGVDLSKMEADAAKKIVDGFIATKHKKEWAKSNTQKAQENAEERKKNEERANELRVKESEVRRKQDVAAAQLARAKKEEKRLSEIAKKGLKREQTVADDGVSIDPDKFAQYIKADQARDRLTEVQEEIQQLEQESSQHDTDRILASLELFQATHPVYATSKSLVETLRETGTAQDYNNPDHRRVLELRDIAEYAASRNITLDVAFEHLKAKNSLAIKQAASTLPSVKTKNAAKEQLVKAIKRNQDGTRFLDGEGGGVSRSAKKETLGDKIRAASQKAQGSGDNEALRKLDY